MANEEHVAILKQGVEAWNKWRKKNPTIVPDLTRVYLGRMHLNKVYLDRVLLRGSELGNVLLKGASLQRADLVDARIYLSDFTGADLIESYLDGVEFYYVNLSGVTFNRAHLSRTHFVKADLTNADWSALSLGDVTFGDVDLGKVKGLDAVQHHGPSYIDIQTIYRSGGNIPDVFLRGAGVPDNFIAYMKSLTGQAFDFYSCFISHSSKDREFVERLYADLQSNGVRCWYAPEDLKIGEPFLLGIDHGIRLHDKLLLVLSEHSVNSGWVQHEVLSAMAKEQGKEPWVLFPIRLDGAVMETNIPWASMIRQSRHVGDFTHWKNHDSYKKAFGKLLEDLKGKK